LSSKKKKTGWEIDRRKFLAALAGLPAAMLLPFDSADAATITPFSFVYLTDTHLVNGQPDNGQKMLQESQLFLQEVIKGINALKPDFVVFGGDQVETVGQNEANWQLFIDLVQALNMPWYFVLGEQDVSGKGFVDKMRQFGPDFKGRGITGNTPYWSVDPATNVHLIGLDTSQANNPTGELSEQQLEWLKNDLSSNKGKFTVVISHHPLLPPAPYDGGPPLDEYVLPNGSDAREILGRSSDVRLVVSGHLYMNKVQLEREVYHVSAAGLDVYPCQYKLFRVNKDAITMESFEVPFAALVKKAKKSLVDSALAGKLNRRNPDAAVQLCEGNPEDQNAFLTLGQNKAVRELSKKQVKEDTEKRDAELERQAEETRNKGKSKGKKSESKKTDEKKTDEKKSDEKRSDEKKTDEKNSDDKKSEKSSEKSKTEKEESTTGKHKGSTKSKSSSSRKSTAPSESELKKEESPPEADKPKEAAPQESTPEKQPNAGENAAPKAGEAGEQGNKTEQIDKSDSKKQ
jgi:hypothetical protein